MGLTGLGQWQILKLLRQLHAAGGQPRWSCPDVFLSSVGRWTWAGEVEHQPGYVWAFFRCCVSSFSASVADLDAQMRASPTTWARSSVMGAWPQRGVDITFEGASPLSLPVLSSGWFPALEITFGDTLGKMDLTNMYSGLSMGKRPGIVGSDDNWLGCQTKSWISASSYPASCCKQTS